MEIAESWQIIERVLQRDAPEVAATLRPGADTAELDRLESQLGFQLPLSFRESWAIHDGQDDPTQLYGLFNYARWLSTSEIIENYQMLQDLFQHEEPIEWRRPDKIQNRIWMPGWIKFTEENGNGFVLDLCPGDNGTHGQVFYRRNSEAPSETLSNSFQEFLGGVARLFSEGMYEIDDGLVVFERLW